MATTEVRPTVSFAERIGRIEISATAAVVNEAERLRGEGADLVDFGAGEPHFAHRKSQISGVSVHITTLLCWSRYVIWRFDCNANWYTQKFVNGIIIREIFRLFQNLATPLNFFGVKYSKNFIER